MKNKMMVGLAVAAVSATFVVLSASAGNAADDCTPSAGTPAVIGAWSWTSFTEWTTDSTTPADPDGQAGEDNLANTIQVGEDHSRTSETTVNDSGWVTEAPAGDDWVLVETNIVSNGDGWVETIPGTSSQWWNFSPNKQQGPFDGPPSFPSDPRGTWQGPHTDGGPDGEGTFQNGNGNGSWFHREPGTSDEVVEHPPTSHEEYRYERTTPGTSEYRWSVYERTNTLGTDPVVCEPDTEQPDTEQPDTEEPAVEQPSTEQPAVEHVQPTGESPAHVSVSAPSSRPAAAVPTVIAAGL